MAAMYQHRTRGATEICSTQEKKSSLRAVDVESALAHSLRNENELLKCQLNDTVNREKYQRLELQKLRQQIDEQVSSLAKASTSQLKAEIDQLKGALSNTSCQLIQAFSEKEQAVSQKEQSDLALEEARKDATALESSMHTRIKSLEGALCKGVGIVSALAESVHAFQYHVLPTFKPHGFENVKLQEKDFIGAEEGILLLKELGRLENELTLLRVVVDAKNDTLVLIRGKLKQENEELKAELKVAHEMKQNTPKPLQTRPDDGGFEKHMLRQELQSLKELHNSEVKRWKEKLRIYETEEQEGNDRVSGVQKELTSLQEKLDSVEASKSSLEASLKEESTARSQLLCELLSLRKFLVRQPRNGRIPPEKMDLMNTVNQLLAEVNHIRSEKVSLEEELKNQRRLQVRERIKEGVTSRDVEMAASNKVGDSELVSRLARARLQQLEAFANTGMASPQHAAGHVATVKSPPTPEHVEAPLTPQRADKPLSLP